MKPKPLKVGDIFSLKSSKNIYKVVFRNAWYIRGIDYSNNEVVIPWESIDTKDATQAKVRSLLKFMF